MKEDFSTALKATLVENELKNKFKEKKLRKNQIVTENGNVLTIIQERFVQEYIKLQDATKAYKAVRPNRRDPCAGGKDLLRKSAVKKEIDCRLKLLRSDSIATGKEIIEFLTSVMKGEVQDQFGLDAPLSERTRAAVELARRTLDIENKFAEDREIKITIERKKH